MSSLEQGPRHGIAPFALVDPANGWDRVVAAVRASERTTIVTSDARYLHAEVVSPWRFYTDDLELLRDDRGRIDVRSSSRIGYYDFDVNRERIEALRRRLAADGVIR